MERFSHSFRVFLGIVTGMLGVLVVAIAFWALILATAFAQSSHDQHHDVYKNWRMPSGASCCSARREANGGIIGDCYQTRFEMRSGNWYALRNNGEWIQIPDGRIVREDNPDPTGESGSLCMTDYAANDPSNVLCARPPNTGG